MGVMGTHYCLLAVPAIFRIIIAFLVLNCDEIEQKTEVVILSSLDLLFKFEVKSFAW